MVGSCVTVGRGFPRSCGGKRLGESGASEGVGSRRWMDASYRRAVSLITDYQAIPATCPCWFNDRHGWGIGSDGWASTVGAATISRNAIV